MKSSVAVKLKFHQPTQGRVKETFYIPFDDLKMIERLEEAGSIVYFIRDNKQRCAEVDESVDEILEQIPIEHRGRISLL